MTLRTADVFVWLLVLLAGLEVTFEYRAKKRGWSTLVFGARNTTLETQPQKPSPFGPSPEFPFRSRIIERHRTADILRFWVASASHAEAKNLSVDKIFPSRTCARLQQAGRHWQVLNASRAGNTINTNIADLKALGPAWHPDVVVLYQMSIDIVDLSRALLDGSGPDDKSHLKSTTDDLENQGEPSTETPTYIARIASETTLYGNIKANFTPLLASQRVLAESLGPRAEREFSARIQNFADSVRELGAIPVLCTFATSHRLAAGDDYPFEVRQFMLRYNMHLSPAGWAHALSRFNDVIRKVALAERLPLIDCDQAMTGNQLFFADFVHFTPRGHERIAELVAERLRELEPALIAVSSKGVRP